MIKDSAAPINTNFIALAKATVIVSESNFSEFLSLIGPKLRERKKLLERLKVLEIVAKTPAPEGRVTREWMETVMKRQSNLSFC